MFLKAAVVGKTSLFDDPVGEGELLVGNGKGEYLRSFQVNHQLEFGRLLDRQERLTGSRRRIVFAAVLGDMLEFFDYFLIVFLRH